MKLTSLLLADPDWERTTIEFVCSHKERFDQLIDCFYSGDFRLAHRATLIILKIAKMNPKWVNEQVGPLAASLQRTQPEWHRRNLLRILQNYRIPEAQWGHVADECFHYLVSADQPVAIKVFSMTVLYNITKDVPDLARELRISIEEQYNLGSAGFQARARKVLGQMQKDGH